MSRSRLELICAHGDQTLSRVRFVVRGSSRLASEQMLHDGLNFIEGRAVASTNLIQAFSYAADPGKSDGSVASSSGPLGDFGAIAVVAVPAEFHLGYGVFTTAYIDRAMKMVLGAPLRYAEARKQLAFYVHDDPEASRKQIEHEIMGGFALNSRPTFTVSPRQVIGIFELGGGLKNVITQLEVSARALEPLNFAVLERALAGLFTVRESAEVVLVPTMARDLLVGTVESVILTHVRIMRWQGLALLGYRFREGHEDVAVAGLRDIAEHQRAIDEYGRRLASSSIFTGELAWLKTYVAGQLGLMRVELEGAEL